MSKPRVTASHEIDPPVRIGSYSDPSETTPRVGLEVTFYLHDHEAALAYLAGAVADVRNQIEDARQEKP